MNEATSAGNTNQERAVRAFIMVCAWTMLIFGALKLWAFYSDSMDLLKFDIVFWFLRKKQVMGITGAFEGAAGLALLATRWGIDKKLYLIFVLGVIFAAYRISYGATPLSCPCLGKIADLVSESTLRYFEAALYGVIALFIVGSLFAYGVVRRHTPSLSR